MVLKAQIGVVKDAIEEMEQVHTHTHTQQDHQSRAICGADGFT